MPITTMPTSWTSDGNPWPPNKLDYFQFIKPWRAADKLVRMMGLGTFPVNSHFLWNARLPNPATISAVVTDDLGRVTGLTIAGANLDEDDSIPNWIGVGVGYNSDGGLNPGSWDVVADENSCTPDPRATFHALIGGYSASGANGSHNDTITFDPIWWWQGASALVGRNINIYRGGAKGTWELRWPEWPNDHEYSCGTIASIQGALSPDDDGYPDVDTGSNNGPYKITLKIEIDESPYPTYSSAPNTPKSLPYGAYAYYDSDGVETAFYFYYEDTDVIVQKTLAITDNDETSVTVPAIPPGSISPDVSSMIGKTWAIMRSFDNYWQRNRNHPWELDNIQSWNPSWYWRGETEGLATVMPDGSIGESAHPATFVTWTDNGGPDGATRTNSYQVYADDFSSTFDPYPGNDWEVPGQSLDYDQPTAPDRYKTFNGLQRWIVSNWSNLTASASYWDGKRWIASLSAAQGFAFAEINSQSTSATGYIDPVAQTGIACSITMPAGYTSLPCCFYIDCATVLAANRVCVGYGTATASGIVVGASSPLVFDDTNPADMTGSTVYLSFGFTGVFGQRVGSVYPKSYFLANTDNVDDAVFPPNDTFAGQYVTTTPSTNFLAHATFGGFSGVITDGSIPFTAGCKARYHGNNREGGIGFPGPLPASPTVYPPTFYVRQRTPTEVASMRRAITAVGTVSGGGFIQSSGAGWYGGSYLVYNSNPTSLSSTVCTDTTKLTGYPDDDGSGTSTPSRLWTNYGFPSGSPGRMIGDTLTIIQTDTDPNGDARIGPNNGGLARITAQDITTPSVTFDEIIGLELTWQYTWYSAFTLTISGAIFIVDSLSTITWPGGGSMRVTSNDADTVTGIVFQTPLPEIGTVTSVGTVTDVSGGTPTTVTDNTIVNILEPSSYEQDKWQQRTVVYTNPDKSTGSFVCTHSLDERAYYASYTGSAPVAGGTFTIQEFKPGEVLQRTSDNTAWNWPALADDTEPDYATRYAWAVNLDTFTATFFNEIKAALSVSTVRLYSGTYTAYQDLASTMPITPLGIGAGGDPSGSGTTGFGLYPCPFNTCENMSASTFYTLMQGAISDGWSFAMGNNCVPSGATTTYCGGSTAIGGSSGDITCGYVPFLGGSTGYDFSATSLGATVTNNTANVTATIINPCGASVTCTAFVYGVIDEDDSLPSFATTPNDDGSGQTVSESIAGSCPASGTYSNTSYGFQADNYAELLWRKYVDVASATTTSTAILIDTSGDISDVPSLPPLLIAPAYGPYTDAAISGMCGGYTVWHCGTDQNYLPGACANQLNWMGININVLADYGSAAQFN